MSSEMIRRNILFVSHVSSKKFGGAERVLDNLVSGINNNSFKTILLLQQPPESETLDWDCQSKTTIEYFDFGSLAHHSKIYSLLAMSIRVVKAFFRMGYLIKKYDIDIVCSNTLIAAVYSGIPARLFAKRFFYYEHNIVDQRKGQLIGMAFKPVVSLATDIICISNSVKKSLEQEGISKEKLHLVHNGFDFKSLDGVTDNFSSLPVRHQKKTLRVGMVANFIPWKRHRVFLELIDQLSLVIPDIKIEAVLVGGCLPGYEDYYQEIERWIATYKGNVDYILEGFQENVADYFRSFDILINPAQAEPFGLIFIEAMYLGCVVVGSIEGAASEIIDNNVTGCIVDYDNTESVIQRLMELAVNIPKRIEMGRNASLQVTDKFAIERQIKKIEELFKK